MPPSGGFRGRLDGCWYARVPPGVQIRVETAGISGAGSADACGGPSVDAVTIPTGAVDGIPRSPARAGAASDGMTGAGRRGRGVPPPDTPEAGGRPHSAHRPPLRGRTFREEVGTPQ